MRGNHAFVPSLLLHVCMSQLTIHSDGSREHCENPESSSAYFSSLSSFFLSSLYLSPFLFVSPLYAFPLRLCPPPPFYMSHLFTVSAFSWSFSSSFQGLSFLFLQLFRLCLCCSFFVCYLCVSLRSVSASIWAPSASISTLFLFVFYLLFSLPSLGCNMRLLTLCLCFARCCMVSFFIVFFCSLPPLSLPSLSRTPVLVPMSLPPWPFSVLCLLCLYVLCLGPLC